MTDANGGKHAVVLSGGGADGAYAVGVMKALFAGESPATAYQPLVPDIFTGTSVGSYNAAFLVGQWETYGPAAIEHLEQVWLNTLSDNAHKCGNGVYRLRANPLEYANLACILPDFFRSASQMVSDSARLAWDGLQRVANLALAQDTALLERVVELFNFSSFVSREPLVQTLHETIRFADIRRATQVLRIATTNWALGILQVFTNQNMTEQLGPLALLASCAIPGFFSPTEIGSQPFVDGGVLMNTPLKLAIDAEADVLHVIYLDPDVKNIPFPRLDNTLEALYRMQILEWAKDFNNDVARAKHINQEIALAHLVIEAMETLRHRIVDENLLKGIPVVEIERQLKPSMEYRPLTIHLYHPSDDLGGALGVLNFDRDRIRRLIDRGFEDAADYTSEHYEVIRPVYPV